MGTFNGLHIPASTLNMPRDPLIGLVGKPSSGKSTTLNSLTDATSKVGNFPFTTIDPQRAIGYLQIECACARHNLSDRCKPNYGACINGRRSVPIELLDVAGLVPGAHEGKGLGNKFLDDLRHADALVHVVDVSGTTDAEGKAANSSQSYSCGDATGTILRIWINSLSSRQNTGQAGTEGAVGALVRRDGRQSCQRIYGREIPYGDSAQ